MRSFEILAHEPIAEIKSGDGAALHELSDAGGRILDEIFEDLARLRRGDDPADTPAGHRPVLGERVGEENAVTLDHHVEEGRRTVTATIIIERIDLVGEDPEAMTARKLEDRLQILMRRCPAGRVRRGIDEEGARLRRDRPLQLLQIQRPPAVGKGQRHGHGAGAAEFDGGNDIGPGRRQIDHLVAGLGQRLHRQHDRLHAGAGHVEMLGREFHAEMAGVITRQRGAQLGNAALPGVEGLAGQKRFARGTVDEIGARQIPLTGPERQEPLAAAGVVDDLDNAAFRGGKRARAKILHHRHGALRLQIPGRKRDLADCHRKIP